MNLHQRIAHLKQYSTDGIDTCPSPQDIDDLVQAVIDSIITVHRMMGHIVSLSVSDVAYLDARHWKLSRGWQKDGEGKSLCCYDRIWESANGYKIEVDGLPDIEIFKPGGKS